METININDKLYIRSCFNFKYKYNISNGNAIFQITLHIIKDGDILNNILCLTDKDKLFDFSYSNHLINFIVGDVKITTSKVNLLTNEMTVKLKSSIINIQSKKQGCYTTRD